MSFKDLLEMSLRNPAKVSAFKKFMTTGRDNSGSLSLVDKIRITKDPMDAAWRMLDADGWKHIGTGMSALVFSNPKYDYVLKIFDKDPAYIKWWNFCKANQGNPYLPKMRGGLTSFTEHFNAVRMERLQSIDSASTDLWIFMDLLVSSNEIADDPDMDLVRRYIWQIPKDHLDLHPGNIMARGHQFVVIDPISGAE